MKSAGKSDPGKIRPINEDSYILSSYPNGYLCLIADGMGGHAAGEVASKIAAEGFAQALQEETRPLSEEIIDELVQKVNHAIYQKSKEDIALSGMGTTLSLAVIKDHTVFLAHIGDSRIYLWQKGKLRQLTKDHTLAAELLRLGEISEKQALTSSYRHMLTRSLGVDSQVKVDIETFALLPNDRLLLCTDGLYNYLTDRELTKYLSKNLPVTKLCEKLTAKALQEGGSDNITVLCIEEEETH